MSFSRIGFCGMAVTALLVSAPVAFGATLTAIEPIAPATSIDVTGVTISPGGQAIVIGNESPTGGTPVIWGGFIWDATHGIQQVVSSDGAPCGLALGVGYRTTGGLPQLVINGSAAGWNTDFFSNDDGVTWVKKRRDTNWPSSNKGPLYVGQNSLGISLDGSAYYTICRKSNTEIFSIKCDDSGGDPPAALVSRDMKSTVEETSVRAASASGLSVGSRKDGSGNERIYVFQHRGLVALPDSGTQAVAYLNGLAGDNFGQAWAVSQIGEQQPGGGVIHRVFGMSPVSGGRTGNWPFMLTVSVTPQVADPTNYDIAETGIQELPTYPDTAGSVTNGLAYATSQDGSFASGMNYRGTERAVLWDLRDADPANWKVYDLTAYFEASGLLGNFIRLSRAYAVAADGTNVVVAGRGIVFVDPDYLTRAFVATIPLSELPLADTGACCAIGSCGSKFAADCPDVSGEQRWTANTLCANAACPGACCTDSMTGACSDFVESATCAGGGGVFAGASSSCAAGTCLGSCCKTDGTCAEEAPGYCGSIDGIAGALGSVCEASTCVGACCVKAGQCEVLAYGECPAAKFKGIGTVCEAGDCPCAIPFADADEDGDVDQADFALFQACYTGPVTGSLSPACGCFDQYPAGGDTAIDENDYAAFEACASGPGIAAALNCGTP